MVRYKIWDKQEDIYTLGKDENGNSHFTAQEYIDSKAPWANIPDVKVVIGSGVINGTVFMEFEAMKEHYARMGATWAEGATDEEILVAIENFEKNPPASNTPTSEERIAAALEFQNLLSM